MNILFQQLSRLFKYFSLTGLFTVTKFWERKQKRLIFIVVFQVRTKMRERGKLGKQKKNNLRMNKSKENTLIYMHIYIHIPTDM